MSDVRPGSGGSSRETGCRLLGLAGERFVEALAFISASAGIAVYDHRPGEAAWSLRESSPGRTLPQVLVTSSQPWQELSLPGGCDRVYEEDAGMTLALSVADDPEALPSSLYLFAYPQPVPADGIPADLLSRVRELVEWCEEGYRQGSSRHTLLRLFGLLSALSHELADISDPLDLMDTVARILVSHLDAFAGCISLETSELLDGELPRHVYFPAEKAGFLRESFGPDGPSPGSEPSSPPPFPEDAARLDIPLSHRGRVLGHIVAWLPAGLARNLSLHRTAEADFLADFSEEVGLRIMNLSLLRRSENLLRERQNRLRELWILQETNSALRGTLEITRILKMILAGATVASGLGFNRAALFLLNEKTGLLQGMLGVGPDSRQDAERIWNELAVDANLPLARQIERYAETQPASSFDGLVKSIRIPLSGRGGILDRCIAERSHINVGGVFPGGDPEDIVYRRLSLQAFAAVPIVARDRVFGVMIVDNLFDGKPISSEDVRLLAMFAEQAGLAIANAREHRAHRRAAEELRLARDQLVQTERLAALGEVAASLAHEIRNPLVSIGGFARRLAAKLSEGDPKSRYASIISSEVQRLERFLEEILLFGKDRAPNLAPVLLEEVVDECLGLFAASFAESGIDVRKSVTAAGGVVLADSGQLKQVFINLFTNALDVMPQGGTLRVRLDADAENPSFLAVVIEDTGGGVDPEVLGSIFNPFFTTKSGGHGLGLSLTQRIVTAHGGRIFVRNNPGEGLVLTISLPIGAADGDDYVKHVRTGQTNGGDASEDDSGR
jgi:signal transduction histidine kinase